jgi:tetratricopeptide (TPR) repeat protein
MPEFLITGRNELGRTVTDMVKTATADDAVEVMRDRGYTDLVLHTDEVTAATFRPSELRKRLSYQQILKLSRLTAYRRFWNILLKANCLFILVLLALVGVNLLLQLIGPGVHWVVIGLSWLSGVLLVNGLGIVWFYTGAAYRIHRLGHAITWARWDAVLELAAPKKGIPAYSQAICRSQALAGLGRLDEALHEFEPYRDCDEIPEWLYWFGRSRILAVAGKRDEAVACLEITVRQSPMNPTMLLELALSVLRVRHDVNFGRSLLTRARQYPISDSSQYVATAVEGLIALHSNDALSARDLFEKALGEMVLIRAHPAVRVIEAQIRAHLATSLARLGEREAAERHFRQAEPLLRAHRRHELIEEYQKAIDGK